MLRVTKSNPCPICNRPDWCLIAADGSAAICQRVQDGSVKRAGDAGWLHVLTEDTARRFKAQSRRPRRSERKYDGPKVDFVKLLREYRQRISQRQLRWLGASLAVSAASLNRLGTGYDGEAFCFPMCDESSRVIGIRRRFGNGRKLCVTGSSNGLFVPGGIDGSGPLMVCEGPTDAAAALDLGFDAFGRPNCDSKVNMTARFAKGRDVIIIADNDTPKRDGRNPGQVGALKLARKLVFVCSSVRIILPPKEYKDLRGWYRAGLKHDELLVTIKNTRPLTAELR